MTNEKPDPRRDNRIAAVLMLLTAVAAGVAATGTTPVVFVPLGIGLTVTALVFAVRGQTSAR